MNRVLVIFIAILCSSCSVNQTKENPRFNPLLTTCGSFVTYHTRRDPTGPIPWCVTPAVYPKEALYNRIEGYAIVEFSVSKSGKISDTRIVESDPRGIFDEAALYSVNNSFYVQSDKGHHNVRRKIDFKMIENQ